MKSIVYNNPLEVILADKPVPQIADGEALIKVSHVGICGTDLNIFQGAHPRAKAPLIMGHELAGTIEKGHPTLPKGAPVTIYPLLSCGHCEPCLNGYPHVCNTLRLIGIDCDGAMAEYVKAPLAKIVPIPETLSMKNGAFIEPIAVGVHAVRRSGYKPGDTAVVFGAGPIGQCVALCLKYFGAGRVIVVEANPYRLGIAKKLGFTVIDAANEDIRAKVKEYTNGRNADLTFDCAAHPSVQAYVLDVLRVQGTSVVVGSYKKPPEVELLKVEFKELTMIGIRVYEPRDFDIAIQVLESDFADFGLLLTEVAPEKAPGMFNDLVKGADAIKVLFKM